MSSTGKTKNKLLETMRMTKADSSTDPAEIEAKSDTKPEMRQTVKNKEKNTPIKKAGKETQKEFIDPYQSSQRVWPD